MAETTSWNPETYAANARFVADLGQAVLQLLHPTASELILDLGCGDGALTEKISSSGAVVLGADSSIAQACAAKNRGLRVVIMDGQNPCFKPQFDAVFSNAALHWMKQPERVINGVWRCLKAGGRFVGELGGKGNVETIRLALHAALRRRGVNPLLVDPWYYPSAEEYSRLLTGSGFKVGYVELLPRPTKLPGDLRQWLETFAQPFSNAIAESARTDFLDEICQRSRLTLQDPEGNWTLDYVRLRFATCKD